MAKLEQFLADHLLLMGAVGIGVACLQVSWSGDRWGCVEVLGTLLALVEVSHNGAEVTGPSCPSLPSHPLSFPLISLPQKALNNVNL
jgi:hypothetical protein